MRVFVSIHRVQASKEEEEEVSNRHSALTPDAQTVYVKVRAYVHTGDEPVH